jgi:hypothetical protein
MGCGVFSHLRACLLRMRLHTSNAKTAAAARLATSVNTSVTTSANTSALGVVAADTTTTATAATATTAASAATTASTASASSGAVSSNSLDSSSDTGYSIRERSDSDMSLDAIEELLDATAAISDNGKSHIHACRHCASINSAIVSGNHLSSRMKQY